MKTVGLCALLFSLTLPVHAESYSLLVHRYEGEIRRQEKQLRSLQANLRDKQEKVTAYKKLAENAKAQWERLADSVKTAQLKVSAVRDTLLKTSRQVQVADWQAALESRLSVSLDAELGFLTAELFRRQWAEASDDADAYPRQIVERLTAYAPEVRQDAQTALQQKQSLEALAQRWQIEEARRRKEAEALKLTQTQEWKRWQDAERRQQLMKEEIAQAEQSAQALQVMLAQLKETRDQARVQHRREGSGSAQDPRLAQLRGALPWPAQGDIVQSFGRQYSSELNQLLISNGIRVQAHAGQPIRSIQPGQVIFARPFRNYGEMVVVQHANGLASVYAGLASMTVKEGATVEALDAIGSVDVTGRYYFELRQEERPLDPLIYLIPPRRMSS